MLKISNKFLSSPFYPLLLFLVIIISIFIASKLYSSSTSHARIYRGEINTTTKQSNLVNTKGIIVDKWKTQEGIVFLKVQGKKGKFDISFFPALGKLPFIPKIGDQIEVLGLLETYQGKPQVSPLSSDAISRRGSVISEENDLSIDSPFPTVEINQLEKYMGETVLLKSVLVKSVEQFTARSGQKMLRFELQNKNSHTVEGVFFEEDWNRKTLSLLNSEKNINLITEVSNFRGKISLIGKRVNP